MKNPLDFVERLSEWFNWEIGVQLRLQIPNGGYFTARGRNEIDVTSGNGLTLIELSPTAVPEPVKRELRVLTWDDRRPDLVFAPDGRFAAVGFGRDILLLKCQSGRIIRTLAGHRSRVRDFSFSMRDPHLASIAVDGTLYLWDWPRGRTIASVAAHSAGRNRVAYSSDGLFLATVGEDGQMRIWQSSIHFENHIADQ